MNSGRRIQFLLFSLLVYSNVNAANIIDADKDKLVKYFQTQIQPEGVKCVLPQNLILQVFADHTIPNCFVRENKNLATSDLILIPKPSCSSDLVHPKLKLVSNSKCPAPAAAVSNTGGASSGAGGLDVQQIAEVGIKAATAVEQYKNATSPGPAKAAVPSVGAAAAGNQRVPEESRTKDDSVASSPNSLVKVDEKVTEFGDRAGAHKAAELRDPNITKSLSPMEDKNITEQISKELKSSGNPTIDDAADLQALSGLKDTAAAEPGKNALDKSNATVLDSTAIEAKSATENANQVFINKMQSQISAAEATANSAIARCSGGYTCASYSALMQSVIVKLNQMKAQLGKYSASQQTCSTSANAAENLCSVIRSPKAILVQQLMTVGTTLLSQMSSASQTCSSTADLSKIAQTGMTLANMACTGVKVTCDMTCKTSTELLAEMGTTVQSIATSLPREAAALSNAITAEQSGSIAPKIVQCQKHAADIMQFATQAVGLLMASKQASDCEKKLTAGGGGVTAKVMTMDELCNDSANASMLVCKCKTDPNGQGCPGAVVKAVDKDLNAPVVKATGTGSQLAGINNFSQSSGLSPAAKAALGLDTSSSAAAALNSRIDSSSTDGAEAGTASDSTSANAANSTASDSQNSQVSLGKEKSKFNFGSFVGGMGSFFGGGSSNKAGSSRKYNDEAHVIAAQRHIASQQLRSEISPPSGKSNFDKVRTRYVESNSSFFDK